MRVALGTAAALVVLLALALVAWGARERTRDPLAALQREPGVVRVLHDSAYEAVTAAGEARVLRDLTLGTERLGVIRLTTSRPAAPVPEPLPMVFILAGLRTGRESLAVLDTHGPNLLVGYQYPYDQETWYQRTKLAQVPVIRRAVLNVPAQVALAAELLARDPSIDGERRSLLGYSFGAMFVPAAQRVAAAQGRPFDALILAFGGADIQRLLEANLKIRPSPLRDALAWIGATAIHPLEPAHHMPHLPGRFLLIRGELDEQIPRELAQRLAELTPEPKDIVALETGHMRPRNRELTARVVRISQDWLSAGGMIAAPSNGY